MTETSQQWTLMGEYDPNIAEFDRKYNKYDQKMLYCAFFEGKQFRYLWKQLSRMTHIDRRL